MAKLAWARANRGAAVPAFGHRSSRPHQERKERFAFAVFLATKGDMPQENWRPYRGCALHQFGSADMKTWTTHSGQKIHRILERRCNCYLVDSGARFLLVDAGRENRWSDLKNRLLRLGVTERSLSALVLTHSHFDHAENAANLQHVFGAAVVVHCLEAAYLQQGNSPAIRGGYGLIRWLTDSLQKPLLVRFQYQPVEADILVQEKMDLQPLGCNGYVLHTPGHTPGSVSVIVDDEIALVGDTLFGVFPGTAFPPFLQDSGLLLQSWAKLLRTRCSLFLPAHGRPRSRALVERCFDRRSR